MTFKNKLKELLSLGAVNISASIILSFFWVYLASILQKTEYGELGFLFSIANVAVTISLMGLRALVVVYESKNENVFPSSFLLVLITATITSAVTFVLTQNVLVSVLIIGMVIFEIILSGLNGHQRYKDFSKHKVIRTVITVIIALIGYQYFGINGILLGYFVSTLLILKDLTSLIKNKRIEFSLLKSKIPFILHAFSRRLNDVFIRWGDKLLIGSLFGFSDLANYYFAVQFLWLLITVPQSLSIYLIPQESKGEKNKKIKIISFIISSLIAIVCIFTIQYPINTFFPQYEESIILMQILSLAIIPLTIISIQESEFFGKENSKAILFGSLVHSGFYLFSIVVFGQVIGLIGLSIGFVLACLLRVCFNILIRKHH